ncbi:MAG: hypothetical protein J6X69_06155 [Bacteroidales bacterium]|nr:hypothetical protein [Bacteroidales bacterium]
MKLHNLNFLLTILTSFLLAACSGVRGEMDGAAVRSAEDGPCEVHFWMDDEGTRTAVASDLHSVCWEDGDHLALWAFKPDHSQALSAQDFVVYGRSDQRAFFSSTLKSPMAEGAYTYWAASPLPSKVQDDYVYFSIPTEQNGQGAGVMFSDLVQAGPLKLREEYAQAEQFALQMSQQLHLLRFYVQDDQQLLGGEKVEKIQFVFPSAVTGTLRASLPVAAEPGVYLSSDQTLQNGSTQLNLVLDQKLAASSGTKREYAFATIFPRQWGSDDSFSARLYSQSKLAIVDEIPLNGRNMRAAHATSVKLTPNRQREYRRIFINFRSNPIGESIKSITLTAPSGCKWGDNTGNTYTISPGKNILPGDSFLLEYEDASAFRTLSTKSVTVTFESEHLTCTQTVKMANLSSASSTTVNLDVAPLLLEDFSTVGDFSSNDEFSASSVGAKDPVTFLNGWAGARVGGKAGVGVRIACRREGGLWVSAEYDARMESAPLACKIKKAVNLKLTFDYGSGGRYTTVLGGPIGQTVKVGYITTTTNYKSNSTSGTYPHSFYISSSDCDGEGGYAATSNSKTFVISAPVTNILRISWRTEIDSKSDFGSTNTNWLYLDNVSVTVNK